ncbi:TPA: hypothetical protein NKQ81_004433 [Vibrio parahaemolyticus]|uniref:hypothetical protein n=1 Tax=Vibrio parahaemolyticus TaxID=670 RepID=UPI00215BA252|nr:hypothetical protein [Vibrio parahaemolyticus]MCR9882111.1 hypothetical protein [Vibrio parahaemolyticus]MCR9894746.1 hypothetical protein [Vibrio parahaemolyticus]HCH1474408.1 hypothetical protein [Vibrio parahaemolyticus]
MALQLIDVFPVKEGPPTQRDIQLAALQGVILPPPKMANTAAELVDDIANQFVSNGLAWEYEQALNQSQEYKAAKSSMPSLKDVPEIKNYRTKHPHFNESLVQSELAKYGDFLSIDQILYHGGAWPVSCNGAIVGSKFVSNKVLSTTLCPQVGALHGTYHTPKQIWVIRIRSSAVKAFVFNNASNQTLSHEKEVLLAQGITFECIDVRTVGIFDILDIVAS